jgi:sugar/nucleoside kinase (ribokinase family)
MAAWGPREIVLTHRDGVLVLADGSFHEAPFRPLKLVGRSGRGDTCIASYVAKRLSASPGVATTWAAAVTSLKMEAEGPIKRNVAEAEDLILRLYAT